MKEDDGVGWKEEDDDGYKCGEERKRKKKDLGRIIYLSKDRVATFEIRYVF